MKTVHEFFTNARMDDLRFEYSWFYSRMVVLAGVVARVESLQGRMGASQSTRQVEGLFESLLAESFREKT